MTTDLTVRVSYCLQPEVTIPHYYCFILDDTNFNYNEVDTFTTAVQSIVFGKKVRVEAMMLLLIEEFHTSLNILL